MPVKLGGRRVSGVCQGDVWVVDLRLALGEGCGADQAFDWSREAEGEGGQDGEENADELHLACGFERVCVLLRVV